MANQPHPTHKAAGTVREPKAPDPTVEARIRASQTELKDIRESIRRSETLTAADFAIQINARD
jgi:hypothetical protein